MKTPFRDSSADLPPEMQRELERLRALATLVTEMVMDGAEGRALLIVRHTAAGVVLVSPVVVAVPLASLIGFVGAALPLYVPLFAEAIRQAVLARKTFPNRESQP